MGSRLTRSDGFKSLHVHYDEYEPTAHEPGAHMKWDDIEKLDYLDDIRLGELLDAEFEARLLRELIKQYPDLDPKSGKLLKFVDEWYPTQHMISPQFTNELGELTDPPIYYFGKYINKSHIGEPKPLSIDAYKAKWDDISEWLANNIHCNIYYGVYFVHYTSQQILAAMKCVKLSQTEALELRIDFS